MPDRGSQRQEALQDADGNALRGVPAVAFRVKPQAGAREPDPPAPESYPGSACSTARVISSASLSCGSMPTAGRSGAGCGDSSSRSSVLTYSAVARVSSSVVTNGSWTPSPCLRRSSLGISHLGDWTAPAGSDGRPARALTTMVAPPGAGRITVSARYDVMLTLPPAYRLAGSEVCRLPGSPTRSCCSIVGSVRTHNRRGRSAVRQREPRRHRYSSCRRTVCASTSPGAQMRWHRTAWPPT